MSSREAREYNQCLRKRAYLTTNDANRAARGAAMRGDQTRVYSCPYCGAYHLTSMVDLRPKVRQGQGSWGFRPDRPSQGT